MAQATETIPDLYVDDLYFSALSDEENDQQTNQQEEIFQVSDSKYAEELQFQETLMASIITSQTSKAPIPTSQMTIQASMNSPAQPLVMITATTAESGESSLSFCEICVERKESDFMFKFETCVHSYCVECITKHIATKIQDSGIKTVNCPGVNCKSVLGIDSCREVLPKEVLLIWEEAVCVDMIDESQKFYCPYKDCSGMLLNEGGDGEVIVEAECPFCHRLFCARCYVPWHSGVGCEEFQRLNVDEREREDIMVMEIAKEKKWGRCPHCKFYVERTEGCPHITCRCNFQFCYGCGLEWTSAHSGCQRG
ncbi:hypothetical protein Dsin_013110 [Dipteronia sinensis]|uniref:RBR-type E3 ubiquitin transferase n=1 Tax=Dipteronia sinensis TaxID=43782 RepID=A0AAE0AK53_9ROSI|nr:hypothetical protein Dsin_013110 [Dipteronia sinensis]